MSSKPVVAESVGPRLVRFRVEHPVIGVGPSWHSLSLQDVDNPHTQLEGWSIAVRGAAVFFVSPPGWRHGTGDRSGTDVHIIELPRTHVTFVWRGLDVKAVDSLQRFDVPPMKRLVPPADVAVAIDSKELGDP